MPKTAIERLLPEFRDEHNTAPHLAMSSQERPSANNCLAVKKSLDGEVGLTFSQRHFHSIISSLPCFGKDWHFCKLMWLRDALSGLLVFLTSLTSLQNLTWATLTSLLPLQKLSLRNASFKEPLGQLGRTQEVGIWWLLSAPGKRVHRLKLFL